MSMTRPRVVFDCNVLLQAAARSQGPSADCLRLAEAGAVSLYVSRPIIQEVRRVLLDSIVRAENLRLNSVRVNAFLVRLTYRAIRIRNVPHVFDLPHDPKDEPYLDLCAHVHADYLVTRDDDFHRLKTAHDKMGKAFRRRFRALHVLDPIEFLAAIRDRME
jgi:putative PIN family toxin of toxin-antitoxin system